MQQTHEERKTTKMQSDQWSINKRHSVFDGLQLIVLPNLINCHTLNTDNKEN